MQLNQIRQGGFGGFLKSTSTTNHLLLKKRRRLLPRQQQQKLLLLPLQQQQRQQQQSSVGIVGTGNDRYSGHGYSGIDRYSGIKSPDDAIFFTVSGITARVEQKFRFF